MEISIMEKKIFVEINNDAWVEENGKRITGKQEFSEKDAERLVNLGVAKYHVETPALQTSTGLVSEVPDLTWKKEEIIALLKENKIEHDEKATKEVLIKVFMDWKDALAGVNRF